MEITFPDYYKEFTCIADKCPDTCCAGWQIVIDKKSLKKYKRVKGDFGNRLRNCICKDKDGDDVFELTEDKRCAFLNDENLCDIYSEIGKDYLCKTCRQYPRHIEEFEDLREVSLSMSCPEAARIILGRKEKVTFHTKTKQMPVEEYEDFDYFLFTKLLEARDVMFDILQDRSTDIILRMDMVLALGHDLQMRIDRGELFAVDGLLQRYEKTGARERFAKCLNGSANSLQEVVSRCFTIFDEMEMINEEYHRKTGKIRSGLGDNTGDAGKWKIIRTAISCGGHSQMEIYLEQIMVYFIYTYFCGAVYGGNAFAKVKLAYVSTILITVIAAADHKGQSEKNISLEEMIGAAYEYCREVEHSDVNLNRLEKMFERKEFSLKHLLLAAVDESADMK